MSSRVLLKNWHMDMCESYNHMILFYSTDSGNMYGLLCIRQCYSQPVSPILHTHIFQKRVFTRSINLLTRHLHTHIHTFFHIVWLHINHVIQSPRQLPTPSHARFFQKKPRACTPVRAFFYCIFINPWSPFIPVTNSHTHTHIFQKRAFKACVCTTRAVLIY